ncbi:MAG: cupin domain-containing protein [Thermoleophilaceae bacterium]
MSNIAQLDSIPPSSVEGTVSAIGPRIAALRHERGWSLQELSRRAGVSPAAIHKIEKKGMTPTITSLMRIAGALGRSVAYLIEEHDRLRPVAVTRRDARSLLTTSKSGVTLESVAGRYGPFFLAGAAATVEPRASSGEEPMNHPGEELMLVLEGTMEWTIEGERYRLDPGDSIHFRTDRPHAWCNPAEEPARAVWLTIRSTS